MERSLIEEKRLGVLSTLGAIKENIIMGAFRRPVDCSDC